MTELQVLLTFLLNLRYVGVSKDVARLTNQLGYIIRHSDFDQAADLVRFLLKFDDAIVSGLNTKRFKLDIPIPVTRYPSSVLPRFLFGLTSRIFDPITGDILINYCDRSVEMALCALRIVRRCSLPGFQKVADQLAIADFVASQESLEPPANKVCSDKESTEIAHSMADFWGYTLEDFEDELQLGFPGPGVTLDMQFPYQPTSVMVDTRSLRGETRDMMVKAIDKFLPTVETEWPDCPIVRAYPYDYQRIGKIVSVEKSFNIGRGITIAPLSSVSIAATLRKTIKNCFRRKNILRFCNVDDQKRSHRLLRRRFKFLCLRDVERGSTCFSVLRQLIYLSRCPKASRMFDDSRLLYIEYDDPKTGPRLVPITTLTMGDASCTAFLTGNMFGLAFLSVAAVEFGYVPGTPLSRDTYDETLSFLDENGDDLLAFVGDDVVIDERYAALFDYLLQSQHVTINHRKSSDANSIHKETCGYWILRSAKESLREIFPFRAPRLSSDIVGNLSSLRSAYERCMRSEFALELLIAYSSVFSHSLEFLNNESHTSTFLGSPVGFRLNARQCVSNRRKSITVPDEIAYVFGFKDCEASPRESRRVQLERGRIVKYFDPAKPRDKQPNHKDQIVASKHSSRTVRPRSTSGAPRAALTNPWVASLMHSFDWLVGLELTS